MQARCLRLLVARLLTVADIIQLPRAAAPSTKWMLAFIAAIPSLRGRAIWMVRQASLPSLKKKPISREMALRNCAEIRTPTPLFRSQVLYPDELRARWKKRHYTDRCTQVNLPAKAAGTEGFEPAYRLTARMLHSRGAF